MNCFRCGSDRPLVVDPTARRYGMCVDCDAALASEPAAGRLAHTETSRTCYLCRRSLPRESFQQRSNGSYFSACKACNRYVLAARRRAIKRAAKLATTGAR